MEHQDSYIRQVKIKGERHNFSLSLSDSLLNEKIQNK